MTSQPTTGESPSTGSTSQGGAQLERSLGLGRLIFYGTGTVLGAGIFVVIGEVVADAGRLSPLSYLIAGFVAFTSGLSYAEIATRIPSAGGPIDYVEKATNHRALGSAAGWALVVANTVSAATITTGFVGYLTNFWDIPGAVVAATLLVSLGLLACFGMKESTWFMTATTLIGVGTLIVVLYATRSDLLDAPARFGRAISTIDGANTVGMLSGAFLAVYSFIGFGDMALTAEEVKSVRKNLPRAIVTTLVVVLTLYLLVALTLVGNESLDEISTASAPLVAAVERHGWSGWSIGIGSLFVIVNGALTQIIGASRLLLDLGRDERGAPRWLGRVNPRSRTPIRATVLVTAGALTLALVVPLEGLATLTSFVVLAVFGAVNLSLVLLKRKSQPEGVPDVWIGVPVLGATTCLGAILARGIELAGLS